MKNLMMIAIAFLTISATAQERKKDGQKGERMEMRNDMTPEEAAKLQTKKMTLELDLTEKQQVEVEKVLLEEAKTRKAKKEEFKSKKDNAEAEKPSKEDRLKMSHARLDHQIEFKKKMKTLLNAEQYEKFDKMLDERKDKYGDKAKMRKQKK